MNPVRRCFRCLPLAAVFACAAQCRAAAPATLVGEIYYEQFFDTNGGHLTRVVLFGGGGTYQELFRVYQDLNLNFEAQTPQAGTFNYTEADPEDSLLSCTSAGATEIRGLWFTAANTGQILTGLGGNFEVEPLTGDGSLINCSVRANVSPGHPATAGIVISGTRWRYVLVRAIGPSLTKLGVAAPLPDPSLALFDHNGNPITSIAPPNPRASFDLLSQFVGAFPLPSDSRDAFQFLQLAPGSYTAQVSSASGGTSGDALIEYYLLP
jgi:hypothetical protein